MRVGVVTFPGSNGDADMRWALDRTDGLEAVALWHGDRDLLGVEAVVLPGGFAFGDYLRCGALARLSPIVDAVTRAARRGQPVLGVCNGFQILCEAGLLPGTLLRNAGLTCVCEDVWVRTEGRSTPFTPPTSQRLRLPVAHRAGRWVAKAETVARVEGEGRVVFRYDGGNPNGSTHDIAGVCSPQGNVVGLMPHPERAVEAQVGGVDGASVFAALVAALGASV